MEPFEVLRDIVLEERFDSVGGAPHVAKVYRHLNTQFFGVPWNDAMTVAGRPMLAYERAFVPAIDPDDPERQPVPSRIRRGSARRGGTTGRRRGGASRRRSGVARRGGAVAPARACRARVAVNPLREASRLPAAEHSPESARCVRLASRVKHRWTRRSWRPSGASSP